MASISDGLEPIIKTILCLSWIDLIQEHAGRVGTILIGMVFELDLLVVAELVNFDQDIEGLVKQVDQVAPLVILQAHELLEENGHVLCFRDEDRHDEFRRERPEVELQAGVDVGPDLFDEVLAPVTKMAGMQSMMPGWPCLFVTAYSPSGSNTNSEPWLSGQFEAMIFIRLLLP